LQATRFGPYELRHSSRELYKLGTKVKLRPQPFQVLSLLLDHPGDVVTREQLRQQLWSSDTFVDFEHSLNTAIKELRGVLNDSATESRFIQTLPKLGYRFIFPIEHSAPNGQPSPAAAAVEPEAIRHPVLAEPATTLPTPRSLRWTWLSIAAAVVLIFGVVMVVARMGVFRHSASGAASAALKPRPSIAVLGFKNLSRKPDDEWMSTAMAEMLAAELASGQQIRVIPSENIAHMKLDLSLAPSDTYGRETLVKIHNHLGTDMVTSGSYLALPDGSSTKLRIVLQVQDTHTGETIASITKDGTESDLPQLISAGGDSLRHTLGIGTLSAAAAREVRASVPSNPGSERLYAQGLVKLQKFDALAARALLEKAVAADPNHALSHSALAESLSILGYDLNAREEAKKALDLSTRLAREDRLSIEGRYRDLTNNRPAALEIYRTLHSFFPDNLDYGLRFANAQIWAGHPADALQTLDALRSLPDPQGTDARIDLMGASAFERLGDMKRSQKAAAASATRAQVQGSGLMLATAINREAWAWLNLGEPDKAIANDTRARELWLAVGDRRNAAKALHGIGIEQKNEGELPKARRSFEEALKEFRLIGANWDIASCSHNLGLLFSEQGELELARTYLEEALRIQRTQNDKRGVSSDLDDLGTVALSSGDLASAKQMKEEALQGFRDIGDKRGESDLLFNLGEVLFQQGELAASAEKYDQAMVVQKEISYNSGLAYSLAGRAEVLTAQDRLDDAFSSAQQSLALRKQIKEGKYSAESDLQIAEIALDQAKPADAESLAREAISVFEKSKALGSASLAYSVLARSLVAQKKLNDARAAAEHAAALAHQGSDRIILMTAGFAQADVDTRTGKAAGAEGDLSALHDRAKRDGYAVFELEARLLLVQAEFASGKPAAARAHLEKLQLDARNKGFLLIARKAHLASPG
jgi:eukaryotic-like serine/threonine-protein kinase